jgi:hypothetical protein
MNPLIKYLIEVKDISQTSILLLLMLPLVATIMAFWRQIIGLRTFGIYAPILITFVFYQLGITPSGINILQGLKYGLALALVVFLTASITHDFTKNIRLHYLPKMSLILSTVSLSVFAILVLASYFNKGGFVSIDTLPILLMITVSEQMISIYIKKGKKAAYMLTLGTIFISILSFILISWGSFQLFILKYPYVSLLTFLVNLIIGKWTAFRLKEYLRFKTILTQSESD